MIIRKDAKNSDILRWDFSVLGAKSYILSMKENISRSIDFKLKKGECISKAPLGYLNVRDKNGKSTVVLDKERAPLVKKIFELYSTDLYSTGDLAEMTKKWGFISKEGEKPLKKLAIHRMLWFYVKVRGKSSIQDYKKRI